MSSEVRLPVPLVDLSAIHEPIRDELEAAFARVLQSSAYSGGPEVAAFEQDLAAYAGSEHALGVGSGTSALQLALMAAGIGPGDEVILPANTFFATCEAVIAAGASPVLCDVDEATANMDAASAEARITERTAAIIMVDLYGQPADADALGKLASQRGLFLLEDAAQSIGATWSGRPAGSLGHAAAFSFYPGKNLGALGEAGAVTTDDPAIAERVGLLRDHGSPAKYRHDLAGFNERMDGLQGAFLAVKLRHLPAWQADRDARVAQYLEALAGVDGVGVFDTRSEARHIWHLLVVRVAERDRVLEALHGVKVGAGIHYPTPIHLLPPCTSLGEPGEFPVSERLANEILTLPVFPGIAPNQVDYVVEQLAAAV